MKTRAALFQALAAIVLSALGIRLASVPLAPSADFQVSPSNPAVGQDTIFIDVSDGAPTSWAWDFGDGFGSGEHNPTHVFAAPGNYVVTLTASNTHGSNQKVRDVVVSPDDTLRLNVAGQHPFIATIQARNQRTGETGPGFAIPQTDIFGYFSLPALTRNPNNPEVFVKVIDGNFFNGHFWVFYGGLTDLEYTLTVQDTLTGATNSYLKPAGSAEGGFDTSAFPGAQAGTTAAWLPTQAIASAWLSGVAPAFPSALRPQVGVPTIEVSPVNPVQSQITRFDIQNLPIGNHDILWTLEPGVVSTDSNPIHAFSTPGEHNVSAFDRVGGHTYSNIITASQIDELRLLPSADPTEPIQVFNIRVTARDPRSMRVASGRAFANNNLFGSYSLPDFTGNPNNAEVVVKMLDGRGVNRNFWTFYGGLTDIQWTMRVGYENLGVDKVYFKDSYSKFGGFDTSGFDATKQPVIYQISPTTVTFGTTFTLLGKNLYGNLIEPFFDDSIGHLKNEKFPLIRLAGGIRNGQDFLDLMPTNPKGIVLTGPLTLPLSLAIDHYLTTAPQPLVLVPSLTSFTPSPTTPTPPTPGTPPPTATPTPPPPTLTLTPNLPTNTPTIPGPTSTPLPGAPVITATSTDDVNDGSIFDAFGMNLGACNVATATFEGIPGVFTLLCQFGDPQSMQLQVPLGGVIPVGSYNLCVTRKNMKGCTSFQMRKH
jgi:PKD repeat protein